uniref:RVS161-like protein RVS162 n=1 Tax=Dermatophagoides pteronyssinus TaxID=6956 RepID=A0A6P6YAL8_DERPT|nr:RVS161-like protein RVS162 [Dermatophagoides pteronyssinus]
MFHRSTSNSSASPNNNDSNDLNNYIASINNYEKIRENICHNVKDLIKSLSALNTIEKKCIDNLSSLNREDEKLIQLLQCWNELIDKSMKNRQDLAICISHTVAEPMKKFQIAFQEIKSAIKRYEQLMNDCNKYNQKLLALKRHDRTSDVIVKQNRFETLLKRTQMDCESLRQTLERELPIFLEKRVEYFQPSFASFICSHILFAGLNLSAIDQSNMDFYDQNESDQQEKQQQLFNTINNLSIIS